MPTDNSQTQPVRVPDLPRGQMVDEKGYPTPEELTFRETLLTLLNDILGNTGLVMPQQTGSNIALIQNNTVLAPDASTPIYPCQFGTMIYQTDAMSGATAVKVAVNDGTGVPTFMTVTLT